MKHQSPTRTRTRTWRIRRLTQPYPDGQQRWDRAYQYLLRWSYAPPHPDHPDYLQPNQPNQSNQEVQHASSRH